MLLIREADRTLSHAPFETDLEKKFKQLMILTCQSLI